MDCPMQPLLLAYNEPWEAGEVQEMESSLPLKRLHCKNSPQSGKTVLHRHSDRFLR
jgi:hypothetical protein